MIYRKKPEHNPQNYLRVILESFEYYNALERIDIANLLFEGFKDVNNKPNMQPNKKAVILELLSKWIQVIEDLGLLGLMFAGYVVKENRTPFEIYTHVNTQKILQFYEKAKRGLPKKAIAKIYAVKTAPELFREGVINRTEYPYSKGQIEKMIKASGENLARLAKLFTSRRRRGKPSYGFLVNVYFQTKHGFKVIHPTETAKKLWQFKDTDILILKDIVRMRSGRNIMRVCLIKEFNEEEAKLLLDRIRGWSEVIREIVGAQIRYLENPNFIVPMIRKLKTEEYIKTSGVKPGRNDNCPCESGLKYKKCCLM